jgi:hypothetical protein
MKNQLILARAVGYHCAALFVNQQVVVSESNSTTVDDVTNSAKKLSGALGAPLIECEVEVPAEMDGRWVWPDLLEYLPPVREEAAKRAFVIYCWSEGGVHPDTVHGPGDAWDDICFGMQAPMPGTPYLMLTPVLSAALIESEQLVEQVAMSILGKERDLAPGVNWHCDRQWRVNDVRKRVRHALEAAGILRASPTPENESLAEAPVDME